MTICKVCPRCSRQLSVALLAMASSVQAENRISCASGTAAALATATASAASSHMYSYNCLASVWDSYENIPR